MKKFYTRHHTAKLIISLLLGFIFFAGSVLAGEIRINDGRNEIRFSPASYQSLSFTSTIASVQYREVQTKLGLFSELFVPGFGSGNTVGDPKLPVIRKLIEVPVNATCVVQITNEKYKEYDLISAGINYPVIPAQAPLSKNITDPNQVPFVYNAATYQLNQWTGGPLATVTPVGTLRSLNLARIDVCPVWYNPVSGKLRVYEELEVTIRFDNADIAATLQMKGKSWSPYFPNLYSSVVNYQDAPDSLITAAPVTFVIVSDPAFNNALQPYIAWKKKKGFNVIVGYTNNPAVGTTTTSIKNYLHGLYDTPPSGYQKPSFILFAGDVSQIPAWTTNGHPSDLKYCEYTNDNIPEVFCGRFAAQNLSQLQAYIDKTLEYEQYTMPSDAFLGEATMVAGADATNGPLYGNGQINYGTNTYFNTAHSILSHTYLQPEPSGGNYATNIHQNVSDGVAFANYTAHGSEAGWADPSFVISDIPALQNDHKYCLMIGNCCKAANFGVTCFSKEVTRVAHKGALGYIGCSDYSYWDEDYWWADGFKAVTTSPVYNPQHLGAYDVTFHDHGESPSEWFVTMGQMVVGGNLAVEESSSGMKQYYWETYCLMGDPSLSVYYSVPGPVAASYPSATIVGTSTLMVTTEPCAYVALAVHDTTLLAAQCADSTGIVNLTFSPLSSPDSLSVVVTKQNRKPHIGFIQVVPATGPYMVLSSYTVNDSLGGNNNHLPDYSESVLLNVTVKNIGVLAATNISGTLSAADTNITITSNTFNFGSVAPGGTVTGPNAFALTIKNNVTDQHHVFCNLQLTDGTNTWNSTLLLILNAPVLSSGAVTVLDPLPGGNNNGILDPGESATLKISTTNSGHAISSNTIAHLTVPASAAPYILVSIPNYYIGSLPVGVPGFGYFPVTTNGITPVGTTVGLDYLATAGSFNQYFTQDTIYLTIGETPIFIMSNNSVTTCSGKFYDAGGPDMNYNDNEDFIYTFQPGTSGAMIRAEFSAFDIEPETSCGYDWLKVFNGPGIASPLLGTYCGTTIGGPYISTSGPLTFQFHSDYSVNMTGWVADISCAGGPLNLIANAFPADVCLGSTSQLVAIPSGGSGNYTYQWNPSSYLDDPTSRTPVSTPLANITYTVTVNDGTSTLNSSPVALTVHPVPLTPTITLTGGSLVSSSSTGNQWYLNDAMIPGANGPVYTPTASGLYYVIVSDTLTGCPSEHSNMINFLMTGIDPLNAPGLVTVYPNPFRENITITYELPETGSVRIVLLDAYGKEIRIVQDHLRQVAGKYRFVMVAGSLNNGVYLLKVRTSSYTITKRLVLSH
ncbi:MAG: C25 family cysteine peptidase [Bacteroidetes bacterium]|nr:C25 family cysteine peptidase [Bacteroidota bacterium]